MFEGCPEHDFFSQPQLKFPMFVFSFTMFSVKDELLGRCCSQWQSVCFETRRTVSGRAITVHPAHGVLWFKFFFCHGPYRGALVKPLHVRLHGDCGAAVSNFVAFVLQVVKKTANNVNPICLGRMREGSAWLGQLESRPSYLHFFYNFHTEVHKCCCLKCLLLQSLTTSDLASQLISTSYDNIV